MLALEAAEHIAPTGEFLGKRGQRLGDQGKGWKEIAVLRAPDTTYGDQFGFSLDLDGRRLVVGARYDDTATTNAGAAYVFKRSGKDWNFEARLEASIPEAEARLGTAVAIKGRDVVVGAPGQDTFHDNAGMVFGYRRQGATWKQVAPLAAFDPMPNDGFGCSLDLSDDLVVVGASGHDSNTGAGYVFRRNGGQEWIAQRRVGPVDQHSWYNFGLSVATHEDRVVIGAVGDDTVTSNAGCAWSYSGNLLDPIEVTAYCYCTNLSPCENVDPDAGCLNSSGLGARLEAGGTVSVSSDDLVLFGSGFPEDAVTQLHFGDAGQFTPYGDGYMCVGGVQNGVFTFPAQVADSGGLVTYGGGLLDQVAGLHGPLAEVGVGETWSFQITFSDPDGPCGLGTNSSNALAVTYAP